MAENAAAERDYAVFLEETAVPLLRQVANVLKVERRAFTLSTPAGGVRLALDRGHEDFLSLALDTTGDSPQVVATTSYTRGSRTIVETRPVRAGIGPGSLTEEDLLEFVVASLEPWL